MQQDGRISSIRFFKSTGHDLRALLSTITKAVKALDDLAKIDITLSEHLVRIDSKASKEAVLHSIAEAGYTPQER